MEGDRTGFVEQAAIGLNPEEATRQRWETPLASTQIWEGRGAFRTP